METSQTTRIFWVPLCPEGEDWRLSRWLGMGLASVFRDLLARRGHDFPTVGMRKGEFKHPEDYWAQGGMAQPGWTALCGSFKHDLSRISLTLLNADSGKRLDQRIFKREASDLDFIDAIASWLSNSSTPQTVADADSVDPAARVLTEAHLVGLEWLLAEERQPAIDEWRRALKQAVDHFAQNLGDRATEDRLRTALLGLSQDLAQRRQDELESNPQRHDEISTYVHQRLEPAGVDLLWPLMELGIHEAKDGEAFRACRGYMRLALGDADRARHDFENFRHRHPRQGWLALARSFEAEGLWEHAQDAFSEALSLSRPDSPFVDAVFGDALPLELRDKTFRGCLLFASGRCYWRSGNRRHAESRLHEAITEGSMEFEAQEVLAHLYRNWGATLSNRDPQQARRRFRQHLDALEYLYQKQPRSQEAQAGLSVAEHLGDDDLRRTWQTRLESLRDHDDQT